MPRTITVAPRAGARIETGWQAQRSGPRVAPRAGARIETLPSRRGRAYLQYLVSPPVRGRGLKRIQCGRRAAEERVAPRAGARIETLGRDGKLRRLSSVAPRAGARIETASHGVVPPRAGDGFVAPRAGARIETGTRHWDRQQRESPPVRGRGLKHAEIAADAGCASESPPVRGRGLKQNQRQPRMPVGSRPPCGGAD